MFLLNSQLTLFTVSHRDWCVRTLCQRPPLIPKLRGQFAEFLNEGSLERLRIFSSPTCVGLRYGHLQNSERRFFLAVSPQPVCFGRSLGSPDPSSALRRALNPDRDIQCPDGLASCVLVARQTPCRWLPNVRGISIAYAFRPQLRTDSPWVD